MRKTRQPRVLLAFLFLMLDSCVLQPPMACGKNSGLDLDRPRPIPEPRAAGLNIPQSPSAAAPLLFRRRLP